MSSTLTRVAHQPSLPVLLVALVRDPAAVFPVLFERADARPELFFSAVSGVYVAYAAAQWLTPADRVGFLGTVVGVLLVGTLLGLVALFFAGGLLSWSADVFRGDSETERMYTVFGYATWPFVPLLLAVVPLEFALYGGAIFSDARPEVHGLVVWAVRAAELSAILVWLLLMVRGTAVAAELSNVRAAETVALSLVEIGVIAVMTAIILVVSIMYW